MTESQQTATGTQSPLIDALGSVLWLAQFSELHRNYPLGYLSARIMPAIRLGQYRIYRRDDGMPLGFVNWAYLDDPRLQAVLSGERWLEPDEWDCGDIPFIPELIAPHLRFERIEEDLRYNVFPEARDVYAIRGQVVAPDQPPPKPRVMKFKGLAAMGGDSAPTVQ